MKYDKKRYKRAAIEIQFNWVFILIVGALIMGFFFSIIQRQKQVADAKLAQDALVNLDLIISGTKSSRGLAGIIEPLPPVGITISCNSRLCTGFGCASSYGIKDFGQRDISTTVIAGPSLIKGSRLTTWTLDWNVPFWVSNFLYLTSPEARYVFVGNDGAASALYDSMPSSTIDDAGIAKPILTKEKIDKLPIANSIASMQDNNNYKIRFIFINDDPTAFIIPLFPNTADADISAVRITFDAAGTSEEKLSKSGKVEYYKLGSGRRFAKADEYYFIAKASLFAAIISDDGQMYDCNMRKALYQLKIISGVFEGKAQQLALTYSLSSQSSHDCKSVFGVYNAAKSSFNALSTINVADGLDYTAKNSINAQLGVLEGYNQQLQKQSCPRIY